MIHVLESGDRDTLWEELHILKSKAARFQEDLAEEKDEIKARDEKLASEEESRI